MIQTIVTAAILYIATALDLLVILLMFFARAKTRKEYRDIYIGQYVGSVALIVIERLKFEKWGDLTEEALNKENINQAIL
ncbi:cadmium resistance transporter, partial [Staphylococcus hominis]|uniref:cadmium resistance transporter n=1 Tax=Staphylococcus hominis TaxID=1290 RepID=UPI003CFF1D90